MGVRIEKVEHIADLMSRGSWTGDSSHRLAKEWEISHTDVLFLAAKAAKSLRRSLGDDKDKWRRWALRTLKDQILPEAMRTKQLAAAVSALREAKEIMGFAAPVRVEMTGIIANMSTEELYAQLEEVRKRAISMLAEKEAESVALLEEGDDIVEGEFEDDAEVDDRDSSKDVDVEDLDDDVADEPGDTG